MLRQLRETRSTSGAHGAAVLVGWLTVALAITSLAGCTGSDSVSDEAADGGNFTTSGQVLLDDVWVDSAQAIEKGQDATIRLTLANNGSRADALVSASSPAAGSTSLSLDGKDVEQLEVGPQQSVDLEANNSSGVVLHDLRSPIKPGVYFNVTFRFAHSLPVTLAVTVGPLGGA